MVPGSRETQERLLARVLVAASTAYCLASLLWFSGTPLGQVPVVDSHQQVALAKLMAEGALPAEPFHRAPLHPFLLSLAGLGGGGELAIYLWARVLNLFSVLLMAWGAARLARDWRAGRPAQAAAYALVSANPVVLFYAGFAFDILPASALGIWSFIAALRYCAREPTQAGWRDLTLASLGFALAAQLRSHFLPVACLWPLLVLLHAGRRAWRAALLSLLPLLLSLAAFAWVNHRVGGEWHATPWQGAYNLYAGNGPAANGRYYAQSIQTSETAAPHENPAKLESLALYAQAHPGAEKASVREMNDYWISETVRHVSAEPLRWLRLCAVKLYAALNNHEQYDNLTYSLHRELSPWLRWNPLGWGLLLSAASAVCLVSPLSGRRALLALVSAYVLGIVLFYPTSRFRLPLLPLLAASAVLLPSVWRERGRRRLMLGLGGAAALLVFSHFARVDEDPAPLQDHRILAYAALASGEEREALIWARTGLRREPADPLLWRTLALACLQAALAGENAGLELQARDFETPVKHPPRGRLFAEALYAFSQDRSPVAEARLRELAAQPSGELGPESLALLLTLGREEGFAPALSLTPEQRGLWLNAVLDLRGREDSSLWLQRRGLEARTLAGALRTLVSRRR